MTIDCFGTPQSFVAPVLGVVLFLAGCSGRNHVPPATADSSTARSALETALAAWKQGASIRDLAQQEPPIVVADEDWLASAKLIDFKLMPDEETAGVSIRWPVRLTISSGATPKTIDAVYVIATSPAIHIARAD